MRQIDEMHTPLLLLRDELRNEWNNDEYGGIRENEAYRDGILYAIISINDMLDIATLGDFDGCKTKPVQGELE